MKKNERKLLYRRALAILMALTIGVTFMPFLDGFTYASSGNDDSTASQEKASDDVSDEENNYLGEISYDELDNQLKSETETNISSAETQKLSVTAVPSYKDVTIKQSGSNIIVRTPNSMVSSDDYGYALRIDREDLNQNVYDTINITLDLKSLDTGYHTADVVVKKYNSKTSKWNYYATARTLRYISINNITARPNYGGYRIQAYSTYLNYQPFFNTTDNRAGKLYMELSPNGGKSWPVRSGYMQQNGWTTPISYNYRIGGLSQNTTYVTRIRYGEVVTYSTSKGGDGKSYFFGGPVRATATVKTGMASKPKIKKVTAKAVNVKRHKTVRPGYYYWTGYHYIWMRPVKMKYYTYNVKVTVKLKKKPGTAGIWVNGRWLPGNKKKYTTKFKLAYPWNMSAKNPRRRVKYTVTVQSGQSPSYGGYSPAYSKRKKLK